jgi:hypothetical protein
MGESEHELVRARLKARYTHLIAECDEAITDEQSWARTGPGRGVNSPSGKPVST